MFRRYSTVARKRVALPATPHIEMHRNTRVDPWPEPLARDIRDALDLQGMNRYPDLERLENRLANWLGIAPARILLSSGVDGVIKSTLGLCTKPGGRVVFLGPTYFMYYIYCKLFDLDAREVTTDPATFGIDVKDVLGAIDDGTDVVCIPNPHMPIENVFGVAEIEAIVRRAGDVNAVVLVDEAYFMFGAPTCVPLIERYDNLVVARSFSKALGAPGLRLGFAMGQAETIEYLRSERHAYEVNGLAAQVAEILLDHLPAVMAYVDDVQRTRSWLTDEVGRLGFDVHGSQSNSILIRTPSPAAAAECGRMLRERHRIIVRDNVLGPAESWLSVTVPQRSTAEVFLAAFRSVVADVSGMRDR